MGEEKKMKTTAKSEDTYDHGNVMMTGYAPCPRGTSVQRQFSYLSIIMEIDIKAGIIENVEFITITPFPYKKHFIIDSYVTRPIKNLHIILHFKNDSLAISRSLCLFEITFLHY